MRMKYHPESGAFEHIPDAETLLLAKVEKENKQLTKENTALKTTLSGLLGILKSKEILTKEETESIEKSIK